VAVWSNNNRYYNYGVVIKLSKQRKNDSIICEVKRAPLYS